MFGWLSLEVTSTSRMNRSRKVGVETSGFMTLIATWRGGCRSWARYTRAMPPVPISRSTV